MFNEGLMYCLTMSPDSFTICDLIQQNVPLTLKTDVAQEPDATAVPVMTHF